MNNLSKHFKALFASGVRVFTTSESPKKLAVIGEVLHHLAFTDKPGLQSDIMNPMKRNSEGRKKNHSEKNRHRSSDFVYEPFGHSYNKGEEFAWGAFVKYW
jgi:hypothetical protein